MQLSCCRQTIIMCAEEHRVFAAHHIECLCRLILEVVLLWPSHSVASSLSIFSWWPLVIDSYPSTPPAQLTNRWNNSPGRTANTNNIFVSNRQQIMFLDSEFLAWWSSALHVLDHFQIKKDIRILKSTWEYKEKITDYVPRQWVLGLMKQCSSCARPFLDKTLEYGEHTTQVKDGPSYRLACSASAR
jgi:hypothetical protein